MVQTSFWPLITSLLALNNPAPLIDEASKLKSNEIPTQAIPEKNVHVHVKVASSVAKSERRLNARLSSTHARPICSGCKRPTSICLCHCLPQKQKIQTQTKILILQHPSEFRRKTVSTVPLIPLVLEQCKVCVGYKFNSNELQNIDFFQEAISRGEKPLLLFPGPDALDLAAIFATDKSFEANSDDNSRTLFLSNNSETKPSLSTSNLLVLLDGTWSQAKRMAHDSPDLISSCQKVQFTGPGNSIYDAIRKEPELHFVSTLECCVQALSYLEPQLSPSLNSDVEVNQIDEKTKDDSSASKAALYLMNALRGLVNQQLQVRNSSDTSPRYVDPKNKYNEKHEKRRLQIEKKLFNTQTPDYYYGKKNEDKNQIISSDSTTPKDGVDVTRLKDGSTLRPLHHSDALLIKPSTTFKTPKSLTEIRRCVCTYPACYGIFRGHELCGHILQDEDGVLGIPDVDHKHREKGYELTLLRKAIEIFENQGRECVTYIEDGDVNLEDLFSNQGWTKTNLSQVKVDGADKISIRKWIKSQ